MKPVQMNAKPLKLTLIFACISLFLASCGDTQKEAAGADIQPAVAPEVLPDTLKIKSHKQPYVITGIGVSGSNKVAIINNKVLQPGMDVAPGVVLEDVQSTYAIIVVGNTQHLLRPGDIQRELDKKGQ